ncbi:hypothetical protein [Enterococcus pallens]|uniref:Uncharacterized protein n=1 Tax=Enterococcus pallens ATCC BAA-351 TaxID=1158607 RepID=R2TC50_9ENTE|nr:hypothetical protein [Enterococcus pallens]EOH97804.1 hypothetical protein UAU_00472 [Enterococcus pallens ATCC BAA-351]EOU20777.1 hypothetical protein I588_01624 [Enterococcus pallens ATCC BAA-351]OJG79261.1 hypothetical protein RV10_GL000763 [Enterococcus pallens]
MSLFNKFFKKNKIEQMDQPTAKSMKEESPAKDNDGWEEVPAFIATDPKGYPLVSLIATAIATGDQPDSQFVVKRILKRNPEAKQVALIAASLAAGAHPDSQLSVRKISKRK